MPDTSATLVTFFYPKIFIGAFSLPYFDDVEQYIYAVVHYTEEFHLVLKQSI
jgi:hypothetical protein